MLLIETAMMSHLLVTASLLLSGVQGLRHCVSTDEDDAPFQITTKRVDDKVEVEADERKAYFSVQSPSGISQAIIERSGNNWPRIVKLRLHLKGLEKLEFKAGKLTLEGSVSSQDGKVRLWKNGKEDQPLNTGPPLWMEIQMVGKNGKPVKTIPLKDGYFEIRLPKALFENNPESITVNWIDFYR